MKVKALLTFLFGIINIQIAFSQSNKDFEKDYLTMKKSVIGIGTVITDTIINNGKKLPIKRFVTIGAGLMTYAKIDTNVITNIVTAGHVIKFFKENNLTSIYLRPSWADTIRTTDYFGVQVPLTNSDRTPNTFLYPDNKIDLGCILMLPGYYDKTYTEKILKDGNNLFPYNSMTTPYLGDQVWIGGYPDHIESTIQNNFLYSIATFKPGYIAWKPSANMSNTDLIHITLVESNATHGNSGGPVFSLQDKIELVGILVAGFDDIDSVYLNNKGVIDPITKQALIAKSRAGVSIIEKAEYVKKLIQFVQSEIDRLRKSGGK